MKNTMTSDEIKRAMFHRANGSEVGRKESAVLAEIERSEAAGRAWDAEWTRERTIARREKWNAAKVTTLTMVATQSRLGFTWADLKMAISRHGL